MLQSDFGFEFLHGDKLKLVYKSVQNGLINGTPHFCIFIDYRGNHRKGVAICNTT
jgi:hypothetical protein